jgi:hypothetical protein
MTSTSTIPTGLLTTASGFTLVGCSLSPPNLPLLLTNAPGLFQAQITAWTRFDRRWSAMPM